MAYNLDGQDYGDGTVTPGPALVTAGAGLMGAYTRGAAPGWNHHFIKPHHSMIFQRVVFHKDLCAPVSHSDVCSDLL